MFPSTPPTAATPSREVRVFESEVLLTIAEVAVAFAGFASLVGILGHQESVDHPLVLSFRMRGMLLTSLLSVAFALVPIILGEYGLGTRPVWTVASLLLLGATLLYVRWLLDMFREMARAQVQTSPLQRRVIVPVVLLTLVLLMGILIANVFVAAPGVYLTALAILLFQSGFAFTLIVFSFLPNRSE
jgi:hypothetical protein